MILGGSLKTHAQAWPQHRRPFAGVAVGGGSMPHRGQLGAGDMRLADLRATFSELRQHGAILTEIVKEDEERSAFQQAFVEVARQRRHTRSSARRQ